jgi:peroxiredoxin
VAVTQGSPQQAQSLCDRFQAPFPCLADPERASYKAFELKRGSLWEVIGPAAIVRGMEAARKGHHIEQAIGDVMQLPGTFIIDGDGIVRYARYARNAADHPRVAELVDALRSMNGER